MTTAPTHIEFIARGLLRSAERVLLCRNTKHGHCYLPGGHVEPGEPAETALEREILEETGAEVRAARPLLACEQRFTQRGVARHEVSVVFHVEHRLPETAPSLEKHIEFLWATAADLRSLHVLPAAIAGRLEAWIAPAWTPEQAEFEWISSRS